MKHTLLLLVCAFALCSNVFAQSPTSSPMIPSLRLADIMSKRLQPDKDSVYTIEVAPHTAEFMQLLTTITLGGEVPGKLNYFFQPGSINRFFIAPRFYEYPAYGPVKYYECNYQYGQVSWNYDIPTQTCKDVKVHLKSGSAFDQYSQLYDIQVGLLSLAEDVKHKRLYDFPVINIQRRDRSELDKLPPQVFAFLDEENFQYDSSLNCYRITITPDVEGATKMFALLNKITKKTKGSTRANTYQLVTPTMDIPIHEVAGSYLYYSYDNNISWYAEKGKVFQVHIYVSDLSKTTVQMALTQHVLSLVVNDIQQDKWTVDNHL